MVLVQGGRYPKANALWLPPPLAFCGLPSCLMTPSSQGPAGIRPGSQLGPYRLVRLLGQGAMGAVYEGVHCELQVSRAVKVLRLDALDADSWARFEREAALGARLDHPGIVRVHEASFETDPPYLVQELVAQHTLRDWLRERGPLPEAEVERLGLELSAALAHAHDKGVLHRDLKPENIILDDAGHPKIIDFGLARSLNKNSERLTATGTVMGTPLYMAPEQSLAEEVDPRTDVYALGATLYHALSGQPPFQEANLIRLLQWVQTQEPKPLVSLRPGLGGRLRGVPRGRPASGRRVALTRHRHGKEEPCQR